MQQCCESYQCVSDNLFFAESESEMRLKLPTDRAVGGTAAAIDTGLYVVVLDTGLYICGGPRRRIVYLWFVV